MPIISFIISCIRWVATHISPYSSAAILEVELPTGFFVRKNELRKYQRVGRIDSQRSRYTKEKVVMYFDYVSLSRFSVIFSVTILFTQINLVHQKYDCLSPWCWETVPSALKMPLNKHRRI